MRTDWDRIIDELTRAAAHLDTAQVELQLKDDEIARLRARVSDLEQRLMAANLPTAPC
jgi:chromosome segregation ATPase